MIIALFIANVLFQEPPPEKKLTPKPTKANKQYGGPGSFVPSGEPSPAHPSRVASTSGAYAHSRQTSETLPSSLRASGSAHLDLYVAPYEQRNKTLPVDVLARDFEEFGVAEPHRRRESFPVGLIDHLPSRYLTVASSLSQLGMDIVHSQLHRPSHPTTHTGTNRPYLMHLPCTCTIGH